jgi:hypothetical protein
MDGTVPFDVDHVEESVRKLTLAVLHSAVISSLKMGQVHTDRGNSKL